MYLSLFVVPPFGVVPQGFPSQALAEGGVSTTELNTDNAQPPPPGTEDLSDLGMDFLSMLY